MSPAVPFIQYYIKLFSFLWRLPHGPYHGNWCTEKLIFSFHFFVMTWALFFFSAKVKRENKEL